jgi:CspA family cold shock protein
MTERFSGMVKMFNASRGFGFIERQGGKDVFFHISAVKSGDPKSIQQGQKVEFSIEKGEKGLQAVNVVILS